MFRKLWNRIGRCAATTTTRGATLAEGRYSAMGVKEVPCFVGELNRMDAAVRLWALRSRCVEDLCDFGYNESTGWHDYCTKGAIATIRRGTFTLGFVCLALVANNAHGELITFAFEGTVTSIQIFIGFGPESLPKVGDPFRGTYTFDSDAVDASGDPFFRGYTTRGAPSGVQVQVGQYEFEGTGTSVSVYDVFIPPPRHDLYSTGSNMELISHPEFAVGLDFNHFGLRIEGNTELLDGFCSFR